MNRGGGETGRVRSGLLAAGWTLAIVFLSVWPFSSAPEIEGSDKVVHALMYASTAVVYLGTNMGFRRSMLLSLALGTAMEAVQAGLPWRSFSGWDMLANLVGVGCTAGWVRAGLPVSWTGWRPTGRNGT